MPVRRSGRHMRARKVMVLVTGAALNRIHSLPIGSAPHLHRMLMAVVSLAREVSGGVAIHAARMAQHRNDGLKSSSAIVRGCAQRRHRMPAGRRLRRMRRFAYSRLRAAQRSRVRE